MRVCFENLPEKWGTGREDHFVRLHLMRISCLKDFPFLSPGGLYRQVLHRKSQNDCADLWRPCQGLPQTHSSRGEYFSVKPIFLHTPKNGPARESRDTLVPGQYYFCTKPKKGNFSAHSSNISAQTPKINVISMHNRIRNSPNLHYITYFNVLPAFSCLCYA